MNDASTAIAVSGLGKNYGSIPALRDLSFEIPAGQFVAMFGPNGAGKTTLISILSTLLQPTEGSAKVAGYETRRQGIEVRRQLGVISHQPWLYGNLTAEENLFFYGRMYGVEDLDKKVATRLLEVGMESWADEPANRFSRGMQQRLTIARALLHDPKVLLLDEPYTGLDRHAAKMLTSALSALRQSQRTILLVTHDLGQGLAQADRVMVLRRGEIVEDLVVDGLDAESFAERYDSLIKR